MTAANTNSSLSCVRIRHVTCNRRGKAQKSVNACLFYPCIKECNDPTCSGTSLTPSPVVHPSLIYCPSPAPASLLFPFSIFNLLSLYRGPNTCFYYYYFLPLEVDYLFFSTCLAKSASNFPLVAAAQTMASTRTTSRYTGHYTKARRSRTFNKDKFNMRDEIIVAGDESDAKRQSSQPIDEITIPLPSETSDKPPDGEDTCKMVPEC